MSKIATDEKGKKMALIAAFLGWMFDGFEMGLFPLIGKPALQDLLAVGGQISTADVDRWFTVIIATFLVGAASGGVFFGWLGDRIGRVKAMTFSIFTYAIFTGLCGFATEAWHIAGLRFIASLGMGGEWALGVALVNELWTKGNRAWVAGAIGAAANIGYLFVALLSIGMNSFVGNITGTLQSLGFSQETVTWLTANSAWRFLMISGAFPAILIFLIRIFVPESDKWEDEKKSGNTNYWNTFDLYGLLVGTLAALVIIWSWSPEGIAAGVTTGYASIITVVMFAVVVWGYLLPVKSYLRRSLAAGSITTEKRSLINRNLLIGSCLTGIALLGTWGATQQAPKWASDLAPGQSFVREYTQMATALGACVFAVLAPVIANILNRRITYMLCCIASLGIAFVFFGTNKEITPYFYVTAFLLGGLTASFYGFFPLYLPELFPTSVRATGQGFSFNVGRIIAAIGGLQLANLVAHFGTPGQAYMALCSIYLVGIVLIWFAPETKGKALS